ncbi:MULTISPECIES: glycosyltransferase family 2 protein [unclassified Sphingobacterium]|uniref:glycosyltransferase family 2 protein n=1 Tax=unclassified Sphingobacterium TaxID=2609468 RepID=UPI0010DECEDD|nr:MULTISPECIES: glycosyltransferase family 2 protein [unclassified Sphingobacterium]MCS3555828.1 glycosyltransferase involved in cell wall biosynthesis [Sphingobacterium sp. JUb21]TCR00719.1 glycosyltransferase involved in cell wall biosynthesis [Sphingobacterium sp. JUb20]
MKSSLISIITPCYNSGHLITATIQSVIAQTYTNWELILVNDASLDNTGEIIDFYANQDSRIRAVHLELNGGIANARNTGIAIANGDYVSFLDSDDLWFSEKLELQISFMKKHDYAFSHTAYQKINIDGDIISKVIQVSKSVNYKALLKHNEIGCLTAMYDVTKVGKRFFKQIGHEDFACWLEILKDGYQSYGISLPLAFYRIHGKTASGNKIKVIGYTWSIYRKIQKLPLLKSLYYFSFYAANSFLKYIK